MKHRIDRQFLSGLSFSALALFASRGMADPAGPPLAPEAADYAVAHERIDVGQGRHLNLYCRGQGNPTVVFDAGTGEQSWDWRYVHPAIGKVTRACVYDRAGYGFSDPSKRAGTAGNAAEDLHALLKGAGIATPVVLVGHSYGGLVAQMFAYLYPHDIAGLVLVDTYHEDATARGDRLLDGKLSQFHQQMTAYFEGCRAAAHVGLKEGDKNWDDCVGNEVEVYGPVLWPVVRDHRRSASLMDAVASERDNEDGATAAGLRAARKSFGDLPLVYLTRGVSPYASPGKTQSAANKIYEDDVLASHDEITALSTRGVDYVVPGADHDIHVEKPQAVIDAVLAVIAMQPRRAD